MTAEFKQAMRRLAGSVAIVTGGTGEGWTGIAATAVMSVAADPPTILVSINRTASLCAVLQREERFCVNLLATRHKEMVSVFGGAVKGLERFATGDWVPSSAGLPVLRNAAASMEARIVSRIDVATHTLFVGEVEAIANHALIDPLIWADGRCATPAFLA